MNSVGQVEARFLSPYCESAAQGRRTATEAPGSFHFIFGTVPEGSIRFAGVRQERPRARPMVIGPAQGEFGSDYETPVIGVHSEWFGRGTGNRQDRQERPSVMGVKGR